MNKVYNLLLVITILISICGCSQKLNDSNNKAKYVFLFIGDGMGTNQVNITELYKSALNGKIGSSKLNISMLPVHSQMTTYSANSNITCSSAAITAMATGYKTNNGVLCKDTSLTIEYNTIAEKVRDAGIKVGIISSVPINHATPAGFYAHQDSRKMYYQIAKELPISKFNYFGGGGLYDSKGENEDSVDVFQIIRDSGYFVSTTNSSFDSVNSNYKYVYSINPQLNYGHDFHWAIDKQPQSISLANFTQQAITQLYGDSGFFIMVEGGKIDWACHKNDAASCIQEVIAFDNAVLKAIDFYNEHPDETLIIVTADHETGGLAYGNGVGYNTEDLQIRLLQNQKISTQKLHRTLNNMNSVDVSFNQVLDTITFYLGLNGEEPLLSLTKTELKWLEEAYINEFKHGEILNPDKDYLKDNKLMPLAVKAVHLLNKKSGIGWISNDHTAMPVPIRAMGVGQDKFYSYIDNTELSGIIEDIMIVSE